METDGWMDVHYDYIYVIVHSLLCNAKDTHTHAHVTSRFVRKDCNRVERRRRHQQFEKLVGDKKKVSSSPKGDDAKLAKYVGWSVESRLF